MALWCKVEQGGGGGEGARQFRHLLESRKLAQSAGEMEWWMHFDWLCWQLGHPEILRSSLDILKDHHDVDEYRLFLLILLSYFDEGVVLGEIDPILQQNEPSSETVFIIGTILCLRERIQRGEIDAARGYFEGNVGMLSLSTGRMPGFLFLMDVEVITKIWGRLAATLSVRVGEMPTEVISQLVPDLFEQLNTLRLSDPSMDSTLGSGHRSSYAIQWRRLCDAMRRIPGDAASVLSSTQDIRDSFPSLCPQLESFRLIITALCMHHLRHPVHHIKAALLASLKVLNGHTQNAQLKIAVLLLVGSLYEETDFEMAIKMCNAVYGMAVTAGWQHWAGISARMLSRGKGLLGLREEATRYEALAKEHESQSQCLKVWYEGDQ